VIKLISKGKITPKRGIKASNHHSVIFTDGEKVDVDLLVFGTGYDAPAGFSFVPSLLHKTYKQVFSISDPSVAFVGFSRPYVGSIPFISEVQSRVIAAAFSEQISLPSAQAMHESNKKDREKQLKMFPRDAKNTESIVNLYDYTDELASMIGAKPNKRLALTNPVLFWKVLRQVHTPFALRLSDKDPKKRRLAKKMIDRYNKHPIVAKLNYVIRIALIVEVFFVAAVVSIIIYLT